MKNRDVLIISTADWDSPIQTNKQYVSKELAKLGYRIIYVESLGIRKIKLKKGDFKRIFKRLKKVITPFLNVDKNIYIVSPILIPGATNKFTIIFNRILLNLKINIAIYFLNFSKDLLWTYNPLTCLYLSVNKFKYRIYHAVDAIENQPYMPKDLIIFYEKILLSNVDKVFVTSKNLLKKLSSLNKNISFYGNVCDFDHFSKSKTIPKNEIPEDIKFIKKPIVGFFGSISEYKLDFNLILEVSKKLKDISFVFIGPDNDLIEKNKINLLRNQNNIYFLGYKEYEKLPNYCAFFDVSWLPLIKNQYTASMFPMKFFEYLASGLPVISTSIDSLQDFKDVAFVVENNSDEVADSIILALQDKGPKLLIRLKRAQENTYKIRTKLMLDEINF